MRALIQVCRGGTLPAALLADYAIFHLEADLRWIELTGARVDELRARLTDNATKPAERSA